MARAEFTEESKQKRPNVQVGDPFMEKLLLEACLEAMQTGAIVGIQDMGVFRACHNDNLIPRYRNTVDLVTVNGSFDKAQFGHSALNGDCDLARVPDTHPDLDLGIATTK